VRSGRAVVEEDAGNVTLPGSLKAYFEAPVRVVDFDPPIGGSNHGHVIQTPEEDGRKGDVLGLSVTRTLFGDGYPPLP
jgi:hypothetical protein